MTFTKTYPFGIYSKEIVRKYPVPAHESIKLYFDLWDRIIASGKRVSNRDVRRLKKA